MPRTTAKAKKGAKKTDASMLAPRRAKRKPVKKPKLDPKEIWARTERRAYEIFEARGRVHGRDFDDWLEAERQILAEV